MKRIMQEGPRCRSQIAELAPYKPVSSLDEIKRYPFEDEPLKLDWNESTVVPSPKVVDRIQRFMANAHHLNWYPDLFSRRLLPALAEHTGRADDEMLVTNGSDDALELLCKSYLEPGDRVVVPRPTYTHFLVFAKAQGGLIRSIMTDDPFARDLEGILAAIDEQTKIVYVVNPNNPTGQLYPPEELARIAEAAPHALIVVDEAYHEFCGVTATGLVGSHPNVVVTRTFSKAYGLAGLRIGYVVAARRVIDTLKRIHNPKGVNVIAQIAARTALEDQAHLTAFVDDVTRAKDYLVRTLGEMGFPCRATPANYVNVQVPDPEWFCAALADRNAYVRNRDSLPGMKGMVRVTVGTPSQMLDLVGRIEAALQTRRVATSA